MLSTKKYKDDIEEAHGKLPRNVFPIFVFDLFLNFVIIVIRDILNFLRAYMWITLFHLQQIFKQIFYQKFTEIKKYHVIDSYRSWGLLWLDCCWRNATLKKNCTGWMKYYQFAEEEIATRMWTTCRTKMF